MIPKTIVTGIMHVIQLKRTYSQKTLIHKDSYSCQVTLIMMKRTGSIDFKLQPGLISPTYSSRKINLDLKNRLLFDQLLNYENTPRKSNFSVIIKTVQIAAVVNSSDQL